MSDICFIADFFADQVNGGGEHNNEILIQLLIESGHQVQKINSHMVTIDFIKQNEDKKFTRLTCHYTWMCSFTLLFSNVKSDF